MSNKTLIFDASPLNHFARAGKLDTLQQLVSGHRCVVTIAVRQELQAGATRHRELAAIDRLPWIETVRVDGLEELYRVAEYLRRLGSTQRNAGEASVLAWAELNGAIAYVDDQVACNVARARGVTVYRTLNLIVRGHRAGYFTEDQAQGLVVDLASTGARFPPQAQTDLFTWARLEHLL